LFGSVEELKTFRREWKKTAGEKNSVLCAGADPPEDAMGREEGLPKGVDKLDWTLKYLEAVAPYCAAVKLNIQYWKASGNMDELAIIVDRAHDLGMVVIDDSKLADIGLTNDAGFFHAKDKNFDAITFSPFAGNIDEAVGMADKYGMGLISMCIMSNPEYEAEKNKLVNVEADVDSYREVDLVYAELLREREGTPAVRRVPHVRQYIQLAHNAEKYGAEIVLGAPSELNHIKESEVADVAYYVGEDTLVLQPGVGGRQDGNVKLTWKYFGKDEVIVNVGGGLMFAKGRNTTHAQQAESAKEWSDTLNTLRSQTHREAYA